MTRRLRILLGVTFLIGGGALLFWTATSARPALTAEMQGLPLLSLFGVALGLACLGASLDAFGWCRAADPVPKIRNTKVYGDAEPASEPVAKAAASGGIRAAPHDQTFAD